MVQQICSWSWLLTLAGHAAEALKKQIFPGDGNVGTPGTEGNLMGKIFLQNPVGPESDLQGEGDGNDRQIPVSNQGRGM